MAGSTFQPVYGTSDILLFCCGHHLKFTAFIFSEMSLERAFKLCKLAEWGVNNPHK